MHVVRSLFVMGSAARALVGLAALGSFSALVPTDLAAATSRPLAALASMVQSVEELRRQAQQVLGPMSNAEILRRVQELGLTPDEIRALLRSRGVSPEVAEPYLRVLEGTADSIPSGTDPLPLTRALGLEAVGRDTVPTTDPRAQPQPTPLFPPPPLEFGPPIFGRELFRRATTQFRPLTTGPVPSNYRLGPGDDLVLVLTGDLEQAYRLEVSRDGWIVIPDVGRIFVSGRTLEELENVLYDRLGTVYSGISRGADATTFFDVTLGGLRTNQVYVVGEVERPGAYSVSAIADPLDALYQAGGPTRSGSFREVLVNRGESVAGRIDLYDYLTGGMRTEGVRLEHGDILHVPVAGNRVQVEGAVVRPGLYELLPGETLADLLFYAGGPEPSAELRSIQIERILSPAQRAPGRDRVVLDIPVTEETVDSIALERGDVVNVFAVLEDPRNVVSITGGVWRPGDFGVGDSTRLWDVIGRAGGLVPDAFATRAQIQRLQPDYTRRLIPVSLERDASGTPVENPVLEGMDQILIFAERELRDERTVRIGGWVREPGTYPFADDMTVADLVLIAGGLRTGAHLVEAEVSRIVISPERADTLTQSFRVGLGEGDPLDDAAAAGNLGRSQAAVFELRDQDAVWVRQSPGFEPQATVVVTGEVLFPGPYSIRNRDERLTDVIARAGGLTEDAYARGFQLWRRRPADVPVDSLSLTREDSTRLVLDSLRVQLQNLPPDSAERARLLERLQPPRAPDRLRVGVAFENAVDDRGSNSNLLLEPGDSIHVPRFIPTVVVRGAVAEPGAVVYREGRGLDYYVRQVGGYVEEADKSRVRIRLANGQVSTRGRRFLVFGGGIEEPDPGSVITVPFEPPSDATGMRISEFVGVVGTLLTAAASIIIAASR